MTSPLRDTLTLTYKGQSIVAEVYVDPKTLNIEVEEFYTTGGTDLTPFELIAQLESVESPLNKAIADAYWAKHKAN